ncbi:MAG TPA: hypothetical protein VFH89_02000 [Sphingomicrobium sp.]|nr:hypothetical protein [Sphingomicrobium sp.]
MSMTMMILMIVVAIAIILALAATRVGGPRVTTIETRREKDEGESE